MANNRYLDKKGQHEVREVGLRTIDQALKDYFDKKLRLFVDDAAEGRKKVGVLFASR